MRALLVAALLLGSCGGDDDATDAGAADAGRDGSLDAGDAAPAAEDAGPRGPLEGPDVAFTNEEACFASALPGDEYVFRWGDGEQDVVAVGHACHRWAYPGSFLVSVSVGGRDASRPLQVVPRPATPRPTHSGPLLYDEVRHRAWVVNADADSVAVIDLGSGTRTELAVCDGPRTLARAGEGVAVACEGDALQLLQDGEVPAPGARVALPVGSRPFGVAGDPRAPGRLLVTLQGAGAVAVIEDGTVAQLVEVGPDPRAITVGGDGRVLLSRWRAESAGATLVEGALGDDGRFEVRGEVALPRQEGLDSDTDNSGVPSFLDALTLTPDGERALVGALKANVVTGTFRTGEPLTSQTTARAVLMEVLPTSDAGGYTESFRLAFDDLDFASAVTTTPLGERIYVAMMGAQRVIALTGFTFEVVGSIADVGVAPRGLAVDRDGRLLVFAELSRELRVYDVSDLSAPPPLLATHATVSAEPLDSQVLWGKQIFHTSADPRMSRTSYLSCASCHLDGEGDNLVWDFTQRGEGLRNTIPLRGHAGTAHGVVHWTGNFDEIQDFENDIRGGQGGRGFLNDEDFRATEDPLGPPKAGRSPELDALAAYVASLTSFGVSPYRRSDASFEAERARGRAAFEAAGCPTCHGGPTFTDSALDVRHDVGTAGPGSGGRRGGPLDGFDTPTLRGLWSSAPYLHDGSAATLREVLTTRNAGDRHGVTSGLTESELDDLELYLLTLDDLDPG